MKVTLIKRSNVYKASRVVIVQILKKLPYPARIQKMLGFPLLNHEPGSDRSFSGEGG
jgi:hypothetical protein